MVLVGAGEGPRAESRQSSVEDISVPAGEAVDIFYRYGKQTWVPIFLHLFCPLLPHPKLSTNEKINRIGGKIGDTPII